MNLQWQWQHAHKTWGKSHQKMLQHKVSPLALELLATGHSERESQFPSGGCHQRGSCGPMPMHIRAALSGPSGNPHKIGGRGNRVVLIETLHMHVYNSQTTKRYVSLWISPLINTSLKHFFKASFGGAWWFNPSRGRMRRIFMSSRPDGTNNMEREREREHMYSRAHAYACTYG